MIGLPDTNYVSRIADWIELFVLSENKSISKSKIISTIENDGGEVDETKVDSAIQELVRRLDLYGTIKPFEIQGNIIKPSFDWKKYPEFTLCLLFSTHGAANADEGTKLFERLTQGCVNHAFAFDSVNLGFPSTTSFKVKLDNLAVKCFESRHDDPTPSDKDRGVDVVAWRNFDDRRNSSIYLLVQCAAGGKWRDKKPIPLSSWKRYIGWNQTTTIPGIAIAQIIESDKWQNAVDEYGVIIDRARLYKSISSPTFSIDTSLRNAIVNWCNKRLN